MKTKKNLLTIALAFVFAGMVSAQDCGYYNMSEGMVFGYQNLDAKGKVTGSSRSTCLNIETTGGTTIYKIKSEYADAKNANQSVREILMKCDAGKFYVDMQSFIDPKSMEGFKDMEISVEGADMMYPSAIIEGEALPDANITISAGTGGMALLNLIVNVTNRKVVGAESVTVPAGTFQCYKITYDVETKLMFKINTTVAEYINKGVGNVKTETFDKKGKLLGTTILNELKK